MTVLGPDAQFAPRWNLTSALPNNADAYPPGGKQLAIARAIAKNFPSPYDFGVWLRTPTAPGKDWKIATGTEYVLLKLAGATNRRVLDLWTSDDSPGYRTLHLSFGAASDERPDAPVNPRHGA